MQKNYYNNKNNDQLIVDMGAKSIAFLKMISTNEGFFVEHPSYQDELITFTYHQLLKKNNNWHNKELFSFVLPRKYILGTNDDRLYESILPFLPKIFGDKILFCSCPINKLDKTNDKNLSMDIYLYKVSNSKIEKITNCLPNQIFFSPIIVGNKIYYGSIADDNLSLNESNSSILNSAQF